MSCPGERQAWDILTGMDPQDVRRNALVAYDGSLSSYTLRSFGQDVHVSLSDRSIRAADPPGERLIEGLGDLSRLSILRYLTDSKDLPLSERLVKPSDLPGGEIFLKGTHVLPLERITERFGDDPDGFLGRAEALGGRQLDYGDVSTELLPFPRAPVAIVVWSGDEELPSTSSLLLDASCIRQLPIDIVWSTAMISVEMMLS